MGKLHSRLGYRLLAIYLSPAYQKVYDRARSAGYSPLDLLLAGILVALASEPVVVRIRGGHRRRLPRLAVEAWRAQGERRNAERNAEP